MSSESIKINVFRTLEWPHFTFRPIPYVVTCQVIPFPLSFSRVLKHKSAHHIHKQFNCVSSDSQVSAIIFEI